MPADGRRHFGADGRQLLGQARRSGLLLERELRALVKLAIEKNQVGRIGADPVAWFGARHADLAEQREGHECKDSESHGELLRRLHER